MISTFTSMIHSGGLKSKMDVKVLSSDEQFKQYVDKFEIFTGIKYPYQYLRCSKVFGIYLEDKLVAGFLLSEGENIRWLKQVPSTCPFISNVDKSLLVEVNGVWMDTAIRKTSYSLKIWSAVCKAVSDAGKPIPTFGFLTERKGLAKLYSKLATGTIYQGQMANSSTEITILYTNLFKIRHFKMLYVTTFLARSFKRIGTVHGST